MPTKLDNRQIVNRSALPMVGNAANDTLDTIFPKIDAELSKLFEDRNFLLADGGTIAVNAGATSVTFTASLKLHVNSLVSGATPSIIDLASTTRAFSADGRMLYAVINRTAATATVTADSATLPAVTSANQEVVLIAKRIGTIIYFRNGIIIPASATRTMDGNIFSTNSLTVNSTEIEGLSTDSTTTGANSTLATPTTPIVRLTNASLTSIDMLAAGITGQQQTIMNVTGTAITLNNLTGGTAANQFLTGTGANLSIANNASIIIKYDGTSSKWRVIGGTGSGSGTGGINYILTPDAESGIVGWSTYSDTQTVTITNASPAVFTVTSTTGYYVGQPHVFTTSGALPTGLTAGTAYYISAVLGASTFKVSATLGGADVNTSSAGSGTHTDRPLVPIDATGGTPTTTWTTSTSAPLRGLTSFLLTKTAADLAGEGVSYAFTIDSADKGKVLQGYVDYAIASGTYVDNDVQFYIYDVTNAVVIQPAPFNLKNTTLPSDRMPFEFQTAINSTSYRLVMHVSSASASAYTLKFDNFNVGPQAKLYGSAVIDWQSYVPTLTGFGAVTGLSAMWKREGDSILVQVNWTTGTVAGILASISLPNSASIDTAKVTASNTSANPGSIVGEFSNQGTNNNTRIVTATGTSTTIVYVGGLFTGAAELTPALGNTVSTTTTACSAYFRVPILGWSSSQVMSSDADTRVVAAIYKTSAAQSIPNTTNTIINFGTSELDTHGAVTAGASWKFTALVPGIYQVSSMIQFASNNYGSSVIFEADLYKNNVQIGGLGYFQNSATGVNVTPSLLGTRLIQLNTGDFIDVRAFQNTGGAQPLTASTVYNYISIERLTGPSQIMASESISSSYWASANFTASTTTPINYDSKEFDSHGAVTPSPSAWKFTAPNSGLYNIKGFFNTSGAASFYIFIYKNGTVYKPIMYNVNGTGAGSFSGDIKLLAGEFIDLRPSISQIFGGGALNTNNASSIAITRTGNY